jgi:hypothetical protein
MREVLEEHCEDFEELLDILSEVFGNQAEGKSFARRPNLTITLTAPGEPPARVVLRPAWDALDKTLDTSRLEMEVLGERKGKRGREVALGLGSWPPKLRGWGIGTGENYLARAAALVCDFLADPAKVLARSADNCCVCGRALTDPVSRGRGVGPECVRVYDYLRWATSGRKGLPPGVARPAPRPRPGKMLYASEDGTALEYQGPATIVQHCAVFGRIETPVRWVKTGTPQEISAFNAGVYVYLKEPRKQNSARITVEPDNTRYVEIHDDKGNVLWDSRKVVPCDMAEWEKTWARFKDKPAFTTRRV